MEKAEITTVSPLEMEVAQVKMMSVRFDCIVRMYDAGQIQPRYEIAFSQKPQPLPPQYFKSTLLLTMEHIQHSDEYAIGAAIKRAYLDLMEHIRQYEEQKP